MQLTKRSLCAAACLFGVVVAGTVSTPKLYAAVKATVVEILLPSKPFFAVAKTPVNFPGPHAVGTDEGTLGVTSLVLTNFNNVTAQINVFQPILSPSAGSCGGPVQSSGGPDSIFMTLRLQPNETLSVPFPTPLVLNPINGHSCLAVEGPAGLFEAYVTGFVN